MDDETTSLLQTRYRQMRTRALLGAAPALVLHVLMQVAPGGGSQGAPVSGTKEVPLPLNVQALEDANAVYAGLMKWTIGHSRALRVQPPAIALGYARAEEPPRGFPSWAQPTDAHAMVHSLVDWLVAYEDAIATRADVAVYWDDVHDIVDPVLKRWPVVRRRPFTSSRPCPLCQKQTLIVGHDEETDVVSVACTYCGHVVPHEHRLKYLEWKEEAPWLSTAS